MKIKEINEKDIDQSLNEDVSVIAVVDKEC